MTEEKLMDLYCHHVTSTLDENSIYGRVILKADGTFEGIETDKNNKPYSFLFGKVSKNKVDLYKSNTSGREVSSYFTETISKKNNSIIKANKVGTACEIKLISSELTRDVTEKEIDFIKLGSNILKSDMSRITKNIYSEFRLVNNKSKEYVKSSK